MMDEKRTTVALVREYDGAQVEFEISHAERILSLRASGWVLPEKSEYELSDGSLVRRNKKGNKGAA